MIIYSVTIHIQKDVETEWLQFMQEKHIQDVINTGYFTHATIRRVITGNETTSTTYNMEYFVENLEEYHAYLKNAAAEMQKDVLDRFAGKFSAERKIYEIIERF